MIGRAGPVTDISDFATEISVTRMKTIPYEHSSPGDRDETFFDKLASLSQHSDRNGAMSVLHAFPLQW